MSLSSRPIHQQDSMQSQRSSIHREESPSTLLYRLQKGYKSWKNTSNTVKRDDVSNASADKISSRSSLDTPALHHRFSYNTKSGKNRHTPEEGFSTTTTISQEDPCQTQDEHFQTIDQVLLSLSLPSSPPSLSSPPPGSHSVDDEESIFDYSLHSADDDASFATLNGSTSSLVGVNFLR